MFLRFVKRRHGSRTVEYAQIAEKYRENGKQKTKVIDHLGPVKNEKDRERYREIFQAGVRKEKIKDTDLERLDFDPPLEFGLMYALRSIMERTGISRSLSILGKYRETAFLMIAGRIMDPGSDISLTRLYSRIYYPWDPPMMGKDDLYRCLDHIHGLKEMIEMNIFKALIPDTSVVHYDLTSSYFEGREDNDLVLFGYSRDKKRGKEQIVIGLVMADGIPIYHEVWPGNTIDPKTLEKTISTLRERFHIGKAIVIADRAFGRGPSLKLLDRNEYITAAYRWDQPYRRIMSETTFSRDDLLDDLYMKEVHVDAADLTDVETTGDEKNLIMKRRHIAVYNSDREKLDLEDIERKMNTVRQKMNEIDDISDLKKSLGKLKSLVKFTKDGAVLNEKRISILKGLSGRFMIITNTNLPVREIVSAYKEQWKIERSFRTIKSFLEIRPVYHRKSERIRAHVFVCILSLLMSRIIEKLSHETIERTAEILADIKAIPVRSPMSIVYCSGSEETSDLLNRMKIDPPDRILVGALPKGH